jgi:putative phosphoribosyl transferase
MHFQDRFEAGKVLSEKLRRYRGRPDVNVLALPRGGVPVAFEVAKALQAPLDVFLVRKLGLPGHEELAMGAVANGDVLVLNDEVVKSLGISSAVIERIAERERRELRRQRRLYRGRSAAPEVIDRVVILVDDGLATGSTMRAAISALKKQHPKRIVVAVPVGAAETCADLRREADEVVCAICPPQFIAVGVWYHDFSPTSDDTVRTLLEEAAQRPQPYGGSAIASTIAVDFHPTIHLQDK